VADHPVTAGLCHTAALSDDLTTLIAMIAPLKLGPTGD
jgi:hypothetical protein